MIYFIPIIVAIAVFLISYFDGYSCSITEYIADIALSFVASILVCFISALVIVFVNTPLNARGVLDYNYDTKTLIETKKIVCLSDNVSSSGSFYLGVGSISSEMNYFYAEDTEYGVIQDHIESDRCFIIEDADDNNTRIDIYSYEGLSNHKILKFLVGEDVISSEIYFIHIPKNSISTNFQINCE